VSGARGGRGHPLGYGAERPGGVDPGPFGLRRVHAAAAAQADRTAQLDEHRVPSGDRDISGIPHPRLS
jgi:hypothetical protein